MWTLYVLLCITFIFSLLKYYKRKKANANIKTITDLKFSHYMLLVISGIFSIGIPILFLIYFCLTFLP